jgi:hypothetical protein
VQQGMQHLRLENRENAMPNNETVTVVVSPSSSGSTKEDRWCNSTEKIQPKTKRAKEAWTSAQDGMQMVTSGTAALLVHQRSSHLSPQVHSESLSQPSVATYCSTMNLVQPCVSTPTNDKMKCDNFIAAQHNAEVVGTLEKMHEMLNENSFSFSENLNARPVAPPSTVYANNYSDGLLQRNGGPFSKIWVVRYVDYTSKYGLGFLFNTGSAGVYFNDSTKIVLSPDGKLFQYIERKKKDGSSSSSGTTAVGSDHTSVKYRIDNFPAELQKKVTLLKHFRDYLLNQEKKEGENDVQSHGFGGNGVEDCGGGFSRQQNLWQEQDPVNVDDDSSMLFLKKWIRTKHAILFRLSNRTVQVVFYDKR